MADIIYCDNTSCPFKKCDKHLCQLKDVKNKNEYVCVANFGGVCRSYISWLIDEIERKGK